MPPKTDKPASTAEPRRSTRLSAAPPSKVEAKDEGKKRTADKPDSKAPAAKKAKPESKPASKPAPTSTAKPASTTKKTPASKAKKSEAILEDDEDKANGDGDKTEDKAEAEAEQPKAAEAEKEAEAPADADTEKPASKAGGKIKEGDVLPKGLKLEDEEGNEVDVGELAKDKGVVLFLYPKANTPGCTNQACGFRDNYAEIQKLGYDVYGLSADKPSPQKNWKTKHNMQYNLLCDPEYKLIKRLGSFSPPKQTKRSSFIFEKGGKLVKAHSAATPATDPKNCLEFIKSHK